MRALAAYRAGFNVGGRSTAMRWAVLATIHRHIWIPSTEPAPQEAIDYGRYLAKKYGWKE